MVHAWDPPDGRGHIAVGYPVGDCPGRHHTTGGIPPPRAAELGQRRRHPGRRGCTRGHPGLRRMQPAVWVADGCKTLVWGDVDGVRGVERGVWGDIANLLRADLPWWPRGLRERDAMLVWRPGRRPTGDRAGHRQTGPSSAT